MVAADGITRQGRVMQCLLVVALFVVAKGSGSSSTDMLPGQFVTSLAGLNGKTIGPTPVGDTLASTMGAGPFPFSACC